MFHFSHITCVGDQGTWEDRAGLVQARKTDKIVRNLLSRGLLGEDALGSCRVAPSWRGAEIKVLTWGKKKGPWLRVSEAL